MHISDIEGEFVPRKGDTVSYRACPIPPRFEKLQASLSGLISHYFRYIWFYKTLQLIQTSTFLQAVHIHIVDFGEGDGTPHRRWENPETPEELEEEKSIKSLPYDV